MRRLLSAGLSRLWINKMFWRTVILMTFIEGLICLILRGQDAVPRDFILFISLQTIGILTSVFFSLFLGTEYSDGTIRNKIIVGHKRRDIYLASLITGVVSVTIIFLAGILTGCIFGVISFAPAYHSISQIAVAGAVGWLASVSYIAIFNLVGMLSSSKAKTAIICILIAFTLIFSALILDILMGQGYVSNTTTAIYQFLFDFNPFGQTMQTVSIEIASPWKLIAYSLVLSSISTGLGLFVFQKKDLK